MSTFDLLHSGRMCVGVFVSLFGWPTATGSTNYPIKAFLGKKVYKKTSVISTARNGVQLQYEMNTFPYCFPLFY